MIHITLHTHQDKEIVCNTQHKGQRHFVCQSMHQQHQCSEA